MTERELRKLKRPKLMEMMLYQSRELLEKNRQIEELTRSYEEALETLARLKRRLDERDAEIAALAGRVPLDGAPEIMAPGGSVSMKEFVTALETTLRHIAGERQAGGGRHD